MEYRMNQFAAHHLRLGWSSAAIETTEPASLNTPCPLHLTLVRRGEPGRSKLERYIRKRYRQAYKADIQQLLPNLLVLRKPNGPIVGALGYRPVDGRPLLLEAYLNRPIEKALSERFGTPRWRSRIVEVDGLVSSMPGGMRWLMALSTAFFKGMGVRWTVFMATPTVLYSFARWGLHSIWLAPVIKERVADAKTRACRYYDVDSWVVASDIQHGFYSMRNTLSNQQGSLAAKTLCGRAYRMGALEG